jgi:hypothetical protein
MQKLAKDVQKGFAYGAGNPPLLRALAKLALTVKSTSQGVVCGSKATRCVRVTLLTTLKGLTHCYLQGLTSSLPTSTSRARASVTQVCHCYASFAGCYVQCKPKVSVYGRNRGGLFYRRRKNCLGTSVALTSNRNRLNGSQNEGRKTAKPRRTSQRSGPEGASGQANSPAAPSQTTQSP